MPTIILTSSEPRCVYVDASDETMMRVHYEVDEDLYKRSHPEYSKTTVHIEVEPFHRVTDTKLHPAHIKHRLRPTEAVLDSHGGQILHQFEMDGKGKICIHSAKASKQNPRLFKFRIQTDEYDASLDKVAKEGDFSKHLSHVETEIRRLEKNMHGVLKTADYIKEQDAVFHKQTQDMDSATVFWPIMHICVLLMTGFTQARHIVEFFKQRRII